MAEAFGGAAGFGERPAVVVVDLNLGFTDPSSPLACDLDDVLVPHRARCSTRRARPGVPVFFTTIVYDEVGEAAAAVFLRKAPALKVLRPGTRWVEIDPRLGRREGEPVLVKAHASAFFGVPFAALLAGRDTLIVCGASTSGCVRATVVDAMQHGLAPIVPRECVGDRSPRAHEQALDDIGGRYGDVVSLDEVVAAIAHTAAIPIADGEQVAGEVERAERRDRQRVGQQAARGQQRAGLGRVLGLDARDGRGDDRPVARRVARPGEEQQDLGDRPPVERRDQQRSRAEHQRARRAERRQPAPREAERSRSRRRRARTPARPEAA